MPTKQKTNAGTVHGLSLRTSEPPKEFDRIQRAVDKTSGKLMRLCRNKGIMNFKIDNEAGKLIWTSNSGEKENRTKRTPKERGGSAELMAA